MPFFLISFLFVSALILSAFIPTRYSDARVNSGVAVVGVHPQLYTSTRSKVTSHHAGIRFPAFSQPLFSSLLYDSTLALGLNHTNTITQTGFTISDIFNRSKLEQRK